ncbi:hypothetical protein FVEG_15930 [Fusarium verticillioides 7600]|uniref:Uncharacterized protein n=1 Tax=Gibberella moniliformis (strain M3125 / FGSC 7600) TaxID=334819 RepID=W7MEZ7_GIBM7|nr:hypothetical protein FVEG_15930 [Fusarium verticillioides 7600]EWG46160.1 hypothetical protein FVEG_15930 [Fusarium verticillioides 7600]RBQ97280.1 hypothetical protein FVER53263_20146 [Fusarium verticillioides]
MCFIHTTRYVCIRCGHQNPVPRTAYCKDADNVEVPCKKTRMQTTSVIDSSKCPQCKAKAAKAKAKECKAEAEGE